MSYKKEKPGFILLIVFVFLGLMASMLMLEADIADTQRRMTQNAIVEAKKQCK